MFIDHLAQQDRAMDFYSKGYRFKSYGDRQSLVRVAQLVAGKVLKTLKGVSSNLTTDTKCLQYQFESDSGHKI